MKNILNNLSENEKNSIREQHEGGMFVNNKRFSHLLESSLGNVKPLINEQESELDDPRIHGIPRNEGPPIPPKPSQRIKKCYEFAKAGYLAPGSDTQFNFPTTISKVTVKGSVAPEFQGIYLHGDDGAPFCYFPTNM